MVWLGVLYGEILPQQDRDTLPNIYTSLLQMGGTMQKFQEWDSKNFQCQHTTPNLQQGIREKLICFSNGMWRLSITYKLAAFARSFYPMDGINWADFTPHSIRFLGIKNDFPLYQCHSAFCTETSEACLQHAKTIPHYPSSCLTAALVYLQSSNTQVSATCSNMHSNPSPWTLIDSVWRKSQVLFVFLIVRRRNLRAERVIILRNYRICCS